ncbi:MAG TPA: PDZ domain-containing protein [Jiangellaceae bacterium]|nr:PDZ domain-containing protein [Jiangellaceae bacterium]
MNRRSVTLVVSGAVIVVLIAAAALLPVPYVMYSPGPTADTLGEYDGEPVIQVEGAQTHPTDGRLDLTTVGVTSADAEVDLVSALRAWVDPDRAVVPREMVYPPGTTVEESQQQNAQQLNVSEQTAMAVALRALGHDVPERVVVGSVVAGAPADGALQAGDAILAVDDTEITEPQDVVDAVTAHGVGETVRFELRRDGERQTVDVSTTAAEGDGRPVVGFSPTVGFDLPIDITIQIDDRIGGPSAGMIFAVAIYDTLTEGALLDGMHVAGTGEINPNGEVGAIGGIQQKISAASDDGADLFLAPSGNCAAAEGANGGDMPVVPVETVDDAVTAIETVAAGDGADLPRCDAS